MKLASALLLISMSSHSLAAPILKAKERSQADGQIISQPVVTQGPNGEKLTVAIEESSPDDRLVARNSAGMKVADVAVYKSTRTERVSVLAAHLNVKGELIAITELNQTGITGGSVIYADNMKTGGSQRLTQITQFPSLVSRIQFEGKDLLAIEIDLGQGANGERPALIRIVDESYGQVVKDIYTQSFIHGRLLKSSNGKLKLLRTGYKVFDLYDVETGTRTNLRPYRSEKAVASVIDTKLGEVVEFQDDGMTIIYNLQALADRKYEIVRQYASDDISFSHEGTYVIEGSKTHILIRDFMTNQQIGKAVSRNPQIPSGPYRDQSSGSVRDLLITETDKIVVINQAELPQSYMIGSMLTYFDLETGKVLRKRRQKLYEVSTELMQDETGRLVSVERSRHGQDIDTRIIDVRANKVTQTLKDDYRQLFTQSQSGRIVRGQRSPEGKLCLAFIDQLNDETCINDDLIKTASSYVASATRGEITVSLDGNRGRQKFSVE